MKLTVNVTKQAEEAASKRFGCISVGDVFSGEMSVCPFNDSVTRIRGRFMKVDTNYVFALAIEIYNDNAMEWYGADGFRNYYVLRGAVVHNYLRLPISKRKERKEMPKFLNDGDSIVVAWAESCSGPGWSNQLVWVLVRERAGKLRIEALQPREQSRDMQAIFRYSALSSSDMTKAAERMASDKRSVRC